MTLGVLVVTRPRFPNLSLQICRFWLGSCCLDRPQHTKTNNYQKYSFVQVPGTFKPYVCAHAYIYIHIHIYICIMCKYILIYI